MNKIKNFFKLIKENELILLYMLFGVALITANCVGAKLFTLGFNMFGAPVVLTVGTIVYPFTFLITDVIGERHGKKAASVAVIGGFIAQIMACILIFLAQILPAASVEAQAAYEAQLGQSFIFVIASLSGYICSQTLDVFVFHKLRNYFLKKNNGKLGWTKWIYNNIATISSQLVDTILYAVIAFGIGFGYGFDILLNMILAQWIIKSILAILDTPFFVLFTRNKKEKTEVVENTTEEK